MALTRVIVKRYVVSNGSSHSLCVCCEWLVRCGHCGAGWLWLSLAPQVDRRGSVQSGAVHVGWVAVSGRLVCVYRIKAWLLRGPSYNYVVF